MAETEDKTLEVNYDKIVAVSPIVKRVEALEFTDPEIPGEIKVDAAGKLLKTYFEYESKIGSLVETYDNWVTNVIPKQLGIRSVDLPRGKVTVRNPVFFKPRILTSDNNWIPMTPRMARDNGYTYSAELYADLVLNVGSDQEEVLSQTSLGKIPVMLGSILCHMRGKTKRELAELGECSNDPFGYFIIKGAEKVILIQEKLRVNRIFMFNSSSKGNVVCKMTCATMLGSSNVTLVKGKTSGALEIHLAFMGRSEAQDKKIGNTVSVFQIYRMLGKSPEEALRMISMFTDKKNVKKIWVQLQPNFLELEKVGDDIEYIAKKKGMGDLDYDIKKTDIMTSLRNELFPQVPPENSEQKLLMLSIMVARFAEYLIGVRKLDDRDNWGNKRLESAGRSLEQLFGNIWREVITRTQDSITSKNQQGLKAVSRDIGASFITDNLVSSFTANNWGVQGSYMPKENITDALKRDSHIAVYSHLTKINTPTSRKAKQTKVRLIQMSQLGYVCPVETPEGQQCGLVKNMSITNYISIDRVNGENITLEYIKPYITKIPTEQSSTPLILNGKFLGWCDGDALRSYTVGLRRQLKLAKDTCIVLSSDRFLYIYTDGARPTRPLLIVNSDGKLVIEEKGLWNAGMDDLLREGCVEYIDAFEQEYIQLAQTMDDISVRKVEIETAQSNYQKALEKISQLEQDLKTAIPGFPAQAIEESIKAAQEGASQASDVLQKLLALPPYTHSEMDPTAILGLAASLVPLANHNQGPRNTYACKMGEQALGIYHSQHSTRFDTTAKCLAYPSRPLFETQMNEVLGMNELPAGDMVIVAIMSYTGYNQEDALIMNKASIERGLFRQIKYKSYKSVQKRTRDTSEEFTRPEVRKGEPESRYAGIDENGIARLGAMVREGDCIIGKVRKNTKLNRVDNACTFVGVGEEGVVDKVLVSTNADGNRVVKVKIRQIRKPEMGDKYASRHAQKSTVGLILSQEDMPYTSSGMVPDIIINPNCIPSRMTIAKLIEIVTSKIASFSGERVNATAFRRFNIKEFKENLRQYKYSPSGKEAMYSGFTGERMEAEIFIGPCYYQALRHHVLDKVQMRSRGAIKQLSHQPVGGRARRGGQRFGEMERDAIISHGASAFLQERLCGVSDAYETIYCSTCGTIAIANHASNKFVCRTCGDDARFGTCTIPYAYKLLTHMLAGAGFNLSFGMSTVDKPHEAYGHVSSGKPQPPMAEPGSELPALPVVVPSVDIATKKIPTTLFNLEEFLK